MLPVSFFSHLFGLLFQFQLWLCLYGFSCAQGTLKAVLPSATFMYNPTCTSWNFCHLPWNSIAIAMLFFFFHPNRLIQTHCIQSTWLHGGRTHLHKFKFSANFSIGLHVIVQMQIKKIQKCLISYVKNYFNRKSVKVQPWTPVEVILNEICLWITVPLYATVV